MAGQMGMEEPFYNDRRMILQDYYKYCLAVLYIINAVCGAMVPCWIPGHKMKTREIKYIQIRKKLQELPHDKDTINED